MERDGRGESQMSNFAIWHHKLRSMNTKKRREKKQQRRWRSLLTTHYNYKIDNFDAIIRYGSGHLIEFGTLREWQRALVMYKHPIALGNVTNIRYGVWHWRFSMKTIWQRNDQKSESIFLHYKLCGHLTVLHIKEQKAWHFKSLVIRSICVDRIRKPSHTHTHRH